MSPSSSDPALPEERGECQEATPHFPPPCSSSLAAPGPHAPDLISQPARLIVRNGIHQALAVAGDL